MASLKVVGDRFIEFTNSVRRWWKLPSSRIIIALLLLLFFINLIALWGILFSGLEAQTAVVRDLQLQATATARGVEALLASMRADFLFLAQSPPVARLKDALYNKDPMVRRWHRLEIEAAFLLFLDSHREIERVSLMVDPGVPFLSFGRREGAPIVLKPGESIPSSVDPKTLFEGRWPVGGSDKFGSIHALLSIPTLLERTTSKRGFALVPEAESINPNPDAVVGSDENPITVEVRDLDWNPPIRWCIVAMDYRKGLIASIEESGRWYQATLLVDLFVILLACGLGALTMHQVRQRAALEAENRRQKDILQLEKKLAEEEHLASVGRLAAGLAHEINNPLEGISNYLDLLEAETREGEPAAAELVEKIREGVRRMAGTTRQVLAFAEPERSAASPQNLEDILTESVGFVRGHPLFREISIRLRLTEQPVQVRGSAVSLGQVFLNLLLNGAQFQQAGGEVDVCCVRKAGKVLVTVADRGPGIPENLLTRIFEPFFSTRNSSGLGLAICRGIIRRHEGNIEAQNRSDGGACFTVSLPALDSTQPHGEHRNSRLVGSGQADHG